MHTPRTTTQCNTLTAIEIIH